MAGSRTVPLYPMLPRHASDSSYKESFVVVSDEELGKHHTKSVPGSGGSIYVYLKSKPGEGIQTVNIGGIRKQYFAVFNEYYREVMDKAGKREIDYAFDKYHVSDIIHDVKYHCTRAIPNQLNWYPRAKDPHIEYPGFSAKDHGQYLSADQIYREIDYVKKCFDILFLYASNEAKAYNVLKGIAEELIKEVNDRATDVHSCKDFKTSLLQILMDLTKRADIELTRLSSSESLSSTVEESGSTAAGAGAIASVLGAVGYGRDASPGKDKVAGAEI